jgi:hypothetical protein
MRHPRVNSASDSDGSGRFLIDEVRGEAVLLREGEDEVATGLRHVREDLGGSRTGDEAEEDEEGRQRSQTGCPDEIRD